jgi:hypothetical protein
MDTALDTTGTTGVICVTQGLGIDPTYDAITSGDKIYLLALYSHSTVNICLVTESTIFEALAADLAINKGATMTTHAINWYTMLTSISAHEGSNKLFTRNSLLRKFSFLLSRIVHLNQYATLPSLAPVGDVAPFTTNLLPRNVICVADTIALSAIYENYMHWEVTITLAPEGDVDPNDKNLLPGTFSVKRKTMYLTKYTLANKWWAITLAPAGGAELSTKNLSPRTPNSATNKKAYWTKFALCLYKLMRIALTPKGSTELCTKQLQDLLSCTPYPNKTHATLISRFYDNPDCKLLEDHHTRTKILNFNSTPFQLTSCTSQYGWNGNEKATDTDLPKLLTTPGDRILSIILKY